MWTQGAIFTPGREAWQLGITRCIFRTHGLSLSDLGWRDVETHNWRRRREADQLCGGGRSGCISRSPTAPLHFRHDRCGSLGAGISGEVDLHSSATGGAACLLATVYFWMTKNYGFWKARGVSGPTPTFPYGNAYGPPLADFLGFEDWIYNTQGGKKYCGYIEMTRPVLYVGDLDLIRAITIKDF